MQFFACIPDPERGQKIYLIHNLRTGEIPSSNIGSLGKIMKIFEVSNLSQAKIKKVIDNSDIIHIHGKKYVKTQKVIEVEGSRYLHYIYFSV